MKTTSLLMIGLLLLTPGLYASEYTEDDAKRRSAEINAALSESRLQADYDSKERAEERHVILRQAFNGCSASKPFSTEQLYQLPSDLEEHIADFTYGAQKLKVLAHIMQPLIPAVITFGNNRLFHELGFPKISNRAPQTYAAKSYFTYYNGRCIVPIEDMPSIASTPHSFCIYYYPKATVYKVCPTNFKKLHVCRMAELHYCMQLYVLRTQKVQAALTAKQVLEGPQAELTLDEQEDAAASIVLTPEQHVIHDGLPEHMKQCLSTNYKLQ